MEKRTYNIEIKDNNGDTIHNEEVNANNLEHLKRFVVGITNTIHEKEDIKFDFCYGSNDYMVTTVENYDGYHVYLIQAKVA